jgi:hypothetical protein
MLKNRNFWILLAAIFILHILTYPSIHHIIDEETYLDIAKNICNGNFTDFFGFIPNRDWSHNTPLYNIILCISSPIHNYNVEKAEIITYIFFILLTVGWYYSIPKDWKVDKNKFVLLLFANSLLWVYSFRVLLDVPLAFFLSLGIFNLYLFFEYNQKKNYYIGCVLTSLALFAKENALLFFPIFFIYFLFKGEKNIKKWFLLVVPLIPFVIFSFAQYISGFPILREFIDVAFKFTNYTYYSYKFYLIPYAKLPTIAFIIGIFGPGLISCLYILKNIPKKKHNIRTFLTFFLIFYLIWEVVFDFLIFVNSPRYHTTLIPFITLIISMASEDKKNLKYVFYLTLFYVLITGFLAAYYFHVQTIEIWKVPLMKILNPR